MRHRCFSGLAFAGERKKILAKAKRFAHDIHYLLELKTVIVSPLVVVIEAATNNLGPHHDRPGRSIAFFLQRLPDPGRLHNDAAKSVLSRATFNAVRIHRKSLGFG